MTQEEIDNLIKNICLANGVSRELAFRKTQEPKCVAARHECILVLKNLGFGPSFISTQLGMSREAVVKVLQREKKKREVSRSSD